MSYCLNVRCRKPQNPPDGKFCQSCGSPLLLGDRYRAIRPIAQGGFGRTFRAVDEYKPSRSACVIKQFLPPSSADASKAAELFRREATQLDELGKHPQIPELLAHFEPNGQQYLVQEFIDGRNLEEELQANGCFTEDRIRQLLLDLLPVLQFIHDRHVIHRDIKPENILCRTSTSSSTGNLVLVDFGASKVLTGTSLNRFGTTIGSAGYVAPEQLKGQVYPASDLYGLGVTCLHLLTQVEPFDLLDIAEGRWKWRDYLPVPLSPPFADLLDRLVCPELNQRYQSAAEVLQVLRSLPKISPTIAPPPAKPSFFNRVLAGIPQAIVGRIVREFGSPEAALNAYDRALAIDPNNAGVWYQKATLYLKLQQLEDAIYCFQKTLKLQPNKSEAWGQLGNLYLRTHRDREAMESYLKFLELQPDQPLAWLCLSAILKRLGDDREARRCLEKAKKLLLTSTAETQANILWQAWDILTR
ncbi:MAG TPA: tetratricopeptide repeat protein [Oscillatoriales cyanobacterium M4454_W2019_049]|nr:MAG: tetratricopeptide repeat protein [Cyanobacteria bacterium J055]HIK33613.1 tetratricopeptide repeat protein [Oscillatoriales cyanobacterium M4454_W2019_049]